MRSPFLFSSTSLFSWGDALPVSEPAWPRDAVAAQVSPQAAAQVRAWLQAAAGEPDGPRDVAAGGRGELPGAPAAERAETPAYWPGVLAEPALAAEEPDAPQDAEPDGLQDALPDDSRAERGELPDAVALRDDWVRWPAGSQAAQAVPDASQDAPQPPDDLPPRCVALFPN
jgi:hypothetical protein